MNGAEAAAPAPDSTPFEIDVVLTGFEPLKLRLNVSPNLAASVAQPESGGSGPPGPPPGLLGRAVRAFRLGRPQCSQNRQNARSPPRSGASGERSIGWADLALKDVLKLTTGSIVELNRAVSEPVEVIVNNCVIARGEVVVIEGNYGVRIHEIISRDKRLRTLR